MARSMLSKVRMLMLYRKFQSLPCMLRRVESRTNALADAFACSESECYGKLLLVKDASVAEDNSRHGDLLKRLGL
jgi:hypothetical protein